MREWLSRKIDYIAIMYLHIIHNVKNVIMTPWICNDFYVQNTQITLLWAYYETVHAYPPIKQHFKTQSAIISTTAPGS